MPSVTFLLPFDHGDSFLIPPDFNWQKAIGDYETSAQWHFNSGFPESIRMPLGSPLLYELKADLPEISKVFETVKFCSNLSEPAECYILFFPIGFGVLVYHAEIQSTIDDSIPCFLEWEESAYNQSLELIVDRACKQYRQLLFHYKISEIDEAKRPAQQIEFPWIYPIFFLNNPLPNPENFKIEWQYASIEFCDYGDRKAKESIFIVASLIWQTLQVTDKLLDSYLYNLSHKLEIGGTFGIGSLVSLQASRAYCARVVDSCYTLRWTIDKKQLELLNNLNEKWSTSLWQQTINSKIDLLTVLYSQNEDNLNQRRNSSFNTVALVIAIVSTISAANDLVTFIYPSASYALPLWERLIIAFSIPAIGIIILLFLLRKPNNRNIHKGARNTK